MIEFEGDLYNPQYIVAAVKGEYGGKFRITIHFYGGLSHEANYDTVRERDEAMERLKAAIASFGSPQ